MAFDVAKCMIRTPEQTREDIESVNRCLNPLSLVSTTDLVAELCSREGVCVESVEGWFMDKKPEKYTIEIDRGHGFIHSSGTQDGPCRIIVVRGGE